MPHESERGGTGSRKKPPAVAVLPTDARLRRISKSRAALIAWVVLAPRISCGSENPGPELSRLKSHVEILASREYGGRSGEVAEKSRLYLVEAFRRLGLAPLFAGSFYQDIPDREPGPPIGRNVGAMIPGSDPKLRDEWVIVAAHFDHLGIRRGVLYPGADDNASAVAMMLEVARSLAESAVRPRRSVMIVGYDLEERGLVGSRYFAEHSPIPLDQVSLFVTADMIGRSLGGVCPRHVFVMGTERTAPSREWVLRAAEGQPLSVAMIGADLLLIDRSDYGPFRARKIPFLFFSTGENPCYHTPADVPETLDYGKLEAISRLIHRVVRRAIEADARPTWLDRPDNGIDEARALLDVFSILSRHRDDLKIGSTPRFLMDRAIAMLKVVVERGSITQSERAALIRLAQVVMAAVF